MSNAFVEALRSLVVMLLIDGWVKKKTIDAVVIATTVVEMAWDGHFGEIELLFAPPLGVVVSAVTVRDAWGAEISKRGPVSTIGEPMSEQVKEGLIRVRIPVISERGDSPCA